MTRWSLSVSEESDFSLRNYLASEGMKKGDLSKFVEEAVSWYLLDKITARVRARTKHVPPAELEADIEEALASIRLRH